MHKAILFLAMLFVIPFMFQEADAIVGQEIQNFTPSFNGFATDANGDNNCGFTFIDEGFVGFSTFGTTNRIGSAALSDPTIDCYRGFWEIDTSIIPDTATILDVTWFAVREEGNGLPTCTVHAITIQPSEVNLGSAADIKNFYHNLANGNQYVTNSNFCIGGSHARDLGALADTDLENGLVNDWFAFSMRRGAEAVQSSAAWADFWKGNAAADVRTQIQVTYTNTIDPVDVLLVTKFILNGVDLAWDEPDTTGAILEGYQINFTTPHGEPITPITNNTFSLLTTATITSLLSDTNYTFRVSAVTEGDNRNAEGKLLNLTTIGLGNFTIGFASLEADNFDARDIKYRRLDQAGDITKLEIVYPVAFNLTCTFDYRFQNTNQTFSNLNTVPEVTSLGITEQKATFTFVNASKEVIGVVCTDVNTNASAPFLLTISNFPIINQLMDFRAGEFGTDGFIGAIDIITLGVIVMVMIGFNRWNETVGAIFAVGLLGGLSFFQIVEWQTFMFGTLAVVIMVIVGSTRKD